MGLLWITMVTFFPGVLVGFLWFKQGISLPQVLLCTAISCALLLAYALPSSHLGAMSGQSYSALVKNVFGRTGNKVVVFNLLWIFIAWYGLVSLFLAESLHGLFHFQIPLVAIAPAFAVIMAFNNFWGFKGVANFARFFAAPLIIVWVSYTLIKAASTCPTTVWSEPATCTFPMALAVIANFVIGVCVWGNEPDYWRYGKPKLSSTASPIIASLCMGMIVFPTTGWLVARMSGITDYGAATNFMNDYSFGGIALLAGLVLSASYFASNDSNLFGSSNALSSIMNIPHKLAVTVLTVLGAIVAAVLSCCGCAQSLEKVASLNCVIVAMPTVILVAEFLIVRKFFSIETDFSRVAADDELPNIRKSALIALIVGCTVGVATANIIPGIDLLHGGICSIQSWVAGILVYLPLRAIELQREANATRTLPITSGGEAVVSPVNAQHG